MLPQSSAFETADGVHLFEQHWLPDGGAKADVVIVHGYAEHSGRYQHVGERLAANGYGVHAFDLRGHGCSGGPRVLVRSLGEHVDDLQLFLDRVRGDGRPLFILAHSMGGTVVMLAAVTRRPDVRGIVLSGAGVVTGRGQSLLMRTALVVGRLFPRLPVWRLDASRVSRDPQVVARYDADPLVHRGRMPAGTLAAIAGGLRMIGDRMHTIATPLLIMHGTADRLTSPAGSRQLYERACASDKTLRLYDGLYHEILNEPEREQVLAEVIGWLDARSGSR